MNGGSDPLLTSQWRGGDIVQYLKKEGDQQWTPILREYHRWLGPDKEPIQLGQMITCGDSMSMEHKCPQGQEEEGQKEPAKGIGRSWMSTRTQAL